MELRTNNYGFVHTLCLIQLVMLMLLFDPSTPHAPTIKENYGVSSPYQHVCTPTSVPLGLHCSEMCIAFHDGLNSVNLDRIGKYQALSKFPCFGLKIFDVFGRGDVLFIQAGLLTDYNGQIIPECINAVRNGLSPKSFAIQALDDNGYPAGIFEYENCEYSCKYCKKSQSSAYNNVITPKNNSRILRYHIEQCRTDVESFKEESTFKNILKGNEIPTVQTLRVEFLGERLNETHNSIWFYWRIDELQFEKRQSTHGSQFDREISIAFTLELELDYKPHIYSSLKDPNNPAYIYTIHTHPFKYLHTFVDTKSSLSGVDCANQLQSCKMSVECSIIRETVHHEDEEKCCPVSNQYMKEVKTGDVPISDFTIIKSEKEKGHAHYFDMSSIYSGCNATKMCVAGIYYDKSPINVYDDDQSCIVGKSCEVLLTIGKAYLTDDEKKNSGYVFLELYGQTPNWVAVGITKDLYMGDDFVIECVKETTQEVFLYVSYNYIDELGRKKNVRLTEKEYYQIVELVDYEENQKELYCAFLVPMNIKFKHLQFRLDYSNNIIFAMGPSRTTIQGYRGNLEDHDNQRYFYRKNVTLGVRHSPLPDEQELLYSHGQLMIVAWVFLLPVATFVGRYFKQSYLHITFFGYKLWLLVHIVFSTLGIIFVFGGYFTLSRSKRDWTFVGTSQSGSLHLWSGLISSSLFFTNMFGGIFIGERSSKRKVLLVEWVHGLIGHAAFLAGFAALYTTPSVILADVPCGFHHVMIVWIVFYFIFHCLMSYHFCWIDFVLGRKTRLICCFFSMKIVFPEGNYKKLTKDEPGTRVRTYMLIAFTGISMIFWISVAFMAGTHKPCYTNEELLTFSLDYSSS